MHVTHFHKVEKIYKVIHLLHKTQNFFILNKYIFTSIVPLAVHKSIRYLFFSPFNDTFLFGIPEVLFVVPVIIVFSGFYFL